MDIGTWLAFVAASTALLLIPGPTVLLVLAYALSRGRKVALATASGVALGDLVAMSASLAGLGALVMASATAFTVLKWVGAVYLIYLGIALIRNAPKASLGLGDATDDKDATGIFWHSALVTALNPKSIAFFIAFVPQFMSPGAPLLWQSVILVATFVGLAAINAFAYALLADRMRQGIHRPGVLRWINRCGGGALVGMGVLSTTVARA
ncbi:MAG: LysE family translocator [Pseudomonadota bacterium]